MHLLSAAAPVAAVDLVRRSRDFSNSTAQEAVIHAPSGRVAELAEPLLNLEDTPFREARSQLELSEDALLLQSVELYQLLRSSRESVMAGEALHAGGGRLRQRRWPPHYERKSIE